MDKKDDRFYATGFSHIILPRDFTVNLIIDRQDIMNKKPAPKTGFARIWAAFLYTRKGLGHALAHEAAFRQETMLVAVLCVVLFFLPLSLLWKGVLFFASAQVLIVELLNSAIEAVVDMTSPGFHELAGRAKDMGSAAVFICLVLAGVIWALALVSMLT
jgi:diacylglycerol kinase (ATP)